MSNCENSPPNASLLCAVSRDGDKLQLRVDLDPFDQSGDDSCPILVISLDLESISIEQADWFDSCVGRPFEAEHWPAQVGSAEIDLYVDFSAEPISIAAQWSTVDRVPRTVLDLGVLVRYLRGCAASYYEDLLSTEAAHRNATARLRTYLEHAIDNSQRKAEHFFETDPARASAEASRADALHRLQAFLDDCDRGVA